MDNKNNAEDEQREIYGNYDNYEELAKGNYQDPNSSDAINQPTDPSFDMAANMEELGAALARGDPNPPGLKKVKSDNSNSETKSEEGNAKDPKSLTEEEKQEINNRSV